MCDRLGCLRCRARAARFSPRGPLGLAWRQPSRGARAWPVLYYRLGGCSALLVFAWRSQQAGAGAAARLLPHLWLLPRALRIVCGCPIPSPASTPFRVVSAFRSLRLVSPMVRAAYPLCACALSLPKCPHLLPLVSPRAHLAWYLTGRCSGCSMWCVPHHVCTSGSFALFVLHWGGRGCCASLPVASWQPPVGSLPSQELC